jgi:DnaJ-class molecular chaperone
MTHEIPCQECGGSGFFGGNGPVVERKCEACDGRGVIVEDGLVNVRPVPKSVFATMTRPEAISLFNQIQERSAHRECFGV